MAEKAKEWQTSIRWLIGLVFIGGIGWKTIDVIDGKTIVNATKIEKVEGKADDNRERIHKNELVQTEINAKLSAIPKIERDLDKLTEHLLKYDYAKIRESN